MIDETGRVTHDRCMNLGAKKTQKYLDDHPTVSAACLARRCGMLPVQLCHLVKSRRIPTLPQAIALNRIARVPYESWFKAA